MIAFILWALDLAYCMFTVAAMGAGLDRPLWRRAMYVIGTPAIVVFTRVRCSLRTARDVPTFLIPYDNHMGITYHSTVTRLWEDAEPFIKLARDALIVVAMRSLWMAA